MGAGLFKARRAGRKPPGTPSRSKPCHSRRIDHTYRHRSGDRVSDTETAKPKRYRLSESLGPGIITGAADDDPSGIATYSQAGSQFGLNMLWSIVLTLPLMIAIQSVAARIGRVTGKGLAANMRSVFPGWLVAVLVLALLLANVVNIAADISAMGEALALVVPQPIPHMYTIGFALISLGLEIFLPYKRYVPVLKWLTLALLAYVAVVMVVKVPWAEVAIRTVMPEFKFDEPSMGMVVALFGTTISPYLFFWQSSQEVEEITDHKDEHALKDAPDEAPVQLSRIRWDTVIGMVFSNLVAFFIILTSAVTLHAHGVTNIDSASKAASALRPIAGDFAFLLFALGIVGTGLLAIPVLAGSAAYAVAEAMGWREGLSRPAREAVGFYAVIAVATGLGVVLDFTRLDPIKALVWAAMLNGAVAPLIMVAAMIIVSKKSLMGKFVVGKLQAVMGWLATAVMAAAAVALGVFSIP